MLSFFCVFGVEFLIQFPVENAYPFFVWSVVLGFILSRIFDTPEKLQEIRWPIYFRIIAAVILIVPTGLFTTSKFIEANNSFDIDKTHFACQVDSMNWRVCSDEARDEVESRAYAKAIDTMKSELYKRPYNFPILRMWGVMKVRIGDIPDSCRAFIFYDRMFVEKSDIHKYVMDTCANMPEMREPFRQGYESYVAKIVNQ